MPLFAVIGDERQVDHALLKYSAKNNPALFIDCSNCANPHSLFPEVSEDALSKVYVMQAEITYKYRDILKKSKKIAETLGVKNIIVTTSNRLFHYQNEEENEAVSGHCWELLRRLGDEFNVWVGVPSREQEMSERYCDATWDYGSFVFKR